MQARLKIGEAYLRKELSALAFEKESVRACICLCVCICMSVCAGLPSVVVAVRSDCSTYLKLHSIGFII